MIEESREGGGEEEGGLGVLVMGERKSVSCDSASGGPAVTPYYITWSQELERGVLCGIERVK